MRVVMSGMMLVRWVVVVVVVAVAKTDKKKVFVARESAR
jgi:hypothetical protein